MAHLTIQQEYMQMPPVTRAYITACVVTTVLVQLNLVSPYQLYFNHTLIFKHYQLWRLVTTFLYCGHTGFRFLFHMLYIYRYCRMLEEGSFRGRTADFVMMMFFGGVCISICALFCSLIFLGQAFIMMLVYIWARRNPFVRMNFFGLINFRAAYLPWVLLSFNVMSDNFKDYILFDLLGMSVGHLYYFLEDVFPIKSGGIRLLKTPQFLKHFLNPLTEDPAYRPPRQFAMG